MKKVMSIVLSLVMILAVNSVAFSALAAGTVVSPGEITNVTGKVNGKESDDVDIKNPNPREYTFTYTGDGTVVGWEFEDMVEGKDYEIIYESDDLTKVTIRVFPEYEGDVVANAIVEFDTSSGTSKDKSKTSPKTGAAAAAGIAAMGAGVAILGALKKKED